MEDVDILGRCHVAGLGADYVTEWLQVKALQLKEKIIIEGVVVDFRPPFLAGFLGLALGGCLGVPRVDADDLSMSK